MQKSDPGMSVLPNRRARENMEDPVEAVIKVLEGQMQKFRIVTCLSHTCRVSEPMGFQERKGGKGQCGTKHRQSPEKLHSQESHHPKNERSSRISQGQLHELGGSFTCQHQH